MSKKLEKIKYIDIVRGIAIFLVVLGHCINKNFADSYYAVGLLRKIIYFSHMPIFFALSGYLFEKNINNNFKKTKRDFIIDKFKRFILPYILFSILNFCLLKIGNNFSAIREILIQKGLANLNVKNAIISILTYENSFDNHLWFLYVMFLILCFTKLFIGKLNKKNFIIIVLISLIGILFSSYLPEIIWKSAKYLLPFTFGRIINIKERYLRNNENKNEIFILPLICSIIILLFNDSFLVNKFSLLIYEISIICFVFYIGKKVIKTNAFFEKIGESKNSMFIYLLHMPFITPAITLFLNRIRIPVFINIFLNTFISIVICLWVGNFLYDKIKFSRILFGIKEAKK